ncbi:MAG: hypothetical protein EUB_03467 [Eubacterium sp.]|uniref:hypothetical protein n=1 Tax=Eubacterium sp. TaxID=142586 RepID=UPI0030534401
MSIKIRVPEINKKQLENPQIKNELEEVQDIFKKADFPFVTDTVNFVFLKGQYYNIEKKMVIIAVFVNKTNEVIQGINASIRLKFRQLNAEIMPMTVAFPEEFVGHLAPDEGLLFHLSIPVKGLKEDVVFSSRDIAGGIENVTLLKSEEKENEK